jgi:hypothetical protein
MEMIMIEGKDRERRIAMKKIEKPVWICLFLLMGFIASFSQTNDTKSSTSKVLPPSILPILILKGSDYEMGFQYGEQIGAFIEKTKEEKWASALKDFTREEVIRALKANQHYIKKYTPEWIAMMEGMADGATSKGYAISYTDVLLMNCTLPKPETSHFPEGAEKDVLPLKKCSVCSAWGSATKDGRLIGVDTLDSPGIPYGVVIVAFPDRGNAYICAADAGEVGDHFLMNDQGLFLGNSGGGNSPRDIDYDYGLCWSCSLPYLVRFADSAKEGKDMVMKWHINLPENFHFADTEGEAYVVEKTSAVQSVRHPGDFGEKDFLFSTNNYLNAEMKVTKEGDFIKKHGGYGAYSAPRNMMIWDMLHNYHGHIDMEFAKMILRFPGSPPPDPPQGGWDAMFCRPTNLWTAVALPHRGDQGVAHICTGPVGRVLHSSLASDGSLMRPTYPYIDGTHTFYQLRLASSPQEMVEDAQKRASESIADAYGKLMHLNFGDAGYAALQEIYSRANAEYFEGRNALRKGLLASGNQALNYLAQAATAFARCQAHARQVYEALVPPPTSPSDLGLRPFGGDWTTWETRIK